MKDLIVSILKAAIERARAAGQLTTAPPTVASVEAPKDPAHGDAASNVALVMARAEKKPPRAIAEIIRANLELPPEVAEANVAGAGFINFRMAPAFWHGELRRAAAEGERFWRPQIGAGRKVQVEFLSANPDRAAHRRPRAQRGARRHARAHARGERLRRHARVLLQQRRTPDEAARRIGARALPRRDRPPRDDARGRLPGRIHPRHRTRRWLRATARRSPTRPIWKFFAHRPKRRSSPTSAAPASASVSASTFTPTNSTSSAAARSTR